MSDRADAWILRACEEPIEARRNFDCCVVRKQNRDGHANLAILDWDYLHSEEAARSKRGIHRRELRIDVSPTIHVRYSSDDVHT